MGSLLTDPVGWSGSMVKSSFRFATFAIFFAVVLLVIVYVAEIRGWRGALGPAIFLGLFQLYLLYALRRLYLIVSTRT
ncbi:MAG TPA: hypothetical protein VNA44_06740 [Burkholderiaceae bacterium]|nr:hypothetical protein [Burkholderiaceae bacterium]